MVKHISFSFSFLNIEYPGACQKTVVHSAFKGHKKGNGPSQGGAGTMIGQFGDSFLRLTGKLLPGCLAGTRQASLVNEGHIRYAKVHPVHPGQMIFKINFKFNKDYKGIEIILFHIVQYLLGKLNKTNEYQVRGINIY